MHTTSESVNHHYKQVFAKHISIFDYEPLLGDIKVD